MRTPGGTPPCSCNHSAASPYGARSWPARSRAGSTDASRRLTTDPHESPPELLGVQPAVQGAGRCSRTGRRSSTAGDLRVPGPVAMRRRCSPSAGMLARGGRALRQALADGILDASVARRSAAGFPLDEGRECLPSQRQRTGWRGRWTRWRGRRASSASCRTIGEIAVGCALATSTLRFAAEPWRPGHDGWRRWHARSRQLPPLARTVPAG